ncbi:MAG: hypothetical protein GXZ01_07235 [Clostridiaceae bacterium]|nr:hypothetical protein [Clostridiaceae bacterium]
MKTYSIHSGLSKGRSIKSGWLVPADYDFWEPLVTYFIRKCTHFRIDCWIGETTAIERAKVHGENLDLGVNNMKAFTGEITDQFISELIHDPFDDEGKIKWFSIFLIKDDRILFSSEHYGSEFSASDLDEEDVEFVRSVMPVDFYLHVYDMDDYHETNF